MTLTYIIYVKNLIQKKWCQVIIPLFRKFFAFKQLLLKNIAQVIQNITQVIQLKYVNM